jgi:general stress protein YciG
MASVREDLTVREAGRLGGLAVLNKHGREFYSEIGREGQRVLRERHPGMASQWGRMGGRPRKLTLAEIMGEGSTDEKRRSGPA